MKVAIVTGAYKGLGLAWCKELISKGYKVVLTARDFDKASVAARSIGEEGINIFPQTLDVTNESEIAELVGWCETTFGKIDLIVNNAGINPKDFQDKEKMAKAFRLDAFDPKVMDEVVHANSYAPLLMVKHFRRLLQKSDRPIVINISSWLGSVGNLSFGGHYGYVGSKNFLNVLNKSMANEIRPEGIISINVNPGWVQTDMGGSKAQFTPEEAVQNIIYNVIEKATISDSGKFLNYDGTEHPW
jgi:NAD(P)-dependent dehydrogenase (short-subunit alcohol dehydrogenase family)